MIGRLQGVLLEKHPPQILMDVQGVGFEVVVPVSTLYQLPDVGQSLILYIHQQIREDAHTLYGFFTLEERALFKEIIKISGIGPKIGLAILSTLSLEELQMAIATKNAQHLSTVPGVGQKTADRLVFELADKLPIGALSGSFATACNSKLNILNDIVGALIALGYSQKESSAMVKHLPDNIDMNTGIRLALKKNAS